MLIGLNMTPEINFYASKLNRLFVKATLNKLSIILFKPTPTLIFTYPIIQSNVHYQLFDYDCNNNPPEKTFPLQSLFFKHVQELLCDGLF